MSKLSHQLDKNEPVKAVNTISLIMPFYENAGMLKVHLNTWRKYRPEVLAAMTFIIIDDCSPVPALPIIAKHAEPHVRRRIRVYRISDNIPWNQHGARNLGAHVCETEHFLMTDMDHLLLADEAKTTVITRWNSRTVRPKRLKAGLIPESDKRHCNTFLTSKQVFLRSGGYDEDYCGSYGGDGPFLRALGNIAPIEDINDFFMVRFPRDVIPDASTVSLERDKEYRDKYMERMSMKRNNGCMAATNPLRFQWERQL